VKNEMTGQPLECCYQHTAVHIEGNDSNYWLQYIYWQGFIKKNKIKNKKHFPSPSQ